MKKTNNFFCLFYFLSTLSFISCKTQKLNTPAPPKAKSADVLDTTKPSPNSLYDELQSAVQELKADKEYRESLVNPTPEEKDFTYQLDNIEKLTKDDIKQLIESGEFSKFLTRLELLDKKFAETEESEATDTTTDSTTQTGPGLSDSKKNLRNIAGVFLLGMGGFLTYRSLKARGGAALKLNNTLSTFGAALAGATPIILSALLFTQEEPPMTAIFGAKVYLGLTGGAAIIAAGLNLNDLINKGTPTKTNPLIPATPKVKGSTSNVRNAILFTAIGAGLIALSATLYLSEDGANTEISASPKAVFADKVMEIFMACSALEKP